MTISIIWLPIIATAISWLWAFFWPMREYHGDYNFGGAIEALARLVAAVVITLLAWLLFFAFT